MNDFPSRPAVRAFTTSASEAALETKRREALRQAQAKIETTEKFSGLRIKNRLVASMVLEDKFANLRFTRIPDVRLSALAPPGRWATAGVLVDKCVKQGSNGQSYSVWKLSDLSPTDYTLTVFMFGQAHLDWCREPEGTMWAVVDGKLREDGKSERPTASCDHPSQVMKLGTSPDYGRCKGTRRDGAPCTMHVNRSRSEYCNYHASAALKSLTTERMALGPGRAPKFVTNGKTVMGVKGKGSRPNMPAPDPAHAQMDRNFRGVSRAPQGEYRDATDQERQRAADKHRRATGHNGRGAAMVTGTVRASGAAAMAMRGTRPGGQITKADVLRNKGNDGGRLERRATVQPGGGKATVMDSGFDGGFGGGPRVSVTRGGGGGGVVAGGGPAASKPVLVEMNDEDVFGDDDLSAVSRAAAIDRVRVELKSKPAPDPNQTRKPLADIRLNPNAPRARAAPALKGLAPPPAEKPRPPVGQSRLAGAAEAVRRGTMAKDSELTAAPARPADRVKGMKRDASSAFGGGERGGGGGGGAPGHCRKLVNVGGSFGDIFGEIADQATDAAESRYAAEAKALEEERMMKTMSVLEQQDNLHTQLTSTTMMDIQASQCLQCGILFERRPPDRCIEANHRAKRVTVKKRWFKCCSCGWRTETLNKPYPPKPCPKCRCEDWDRAGMSARADRMKGPAMDDVASRDQMLARGVEHDFSLNSLGGGGNYLSKDDEPEVA